MKKFLIPALFSLVSFGAVAQADPLISKVFTVAELRADVDTLYKWVTETHASLYTVITKQEADAKWMLLRKSIAGPMTRIEFMRLALPVLTQYRDGHTGMSPEFDFPEFQLYTQGGGKLFPLKVMIRKDRIWCAANYLDNGVVVPGDEIIAINGKPARELIRELLPVWPADDAASNEVIVSRLFSFSLWVSYGWGNQCTVTVKKSNGKFTIGLAGIEANAYLDRYFSAIKTWNLEVYPQNKLAVITSGAYSGSGEKTRRFLDSAFTIIKNSGAEHLALDIRNNGGGNSALGRMLLGYISQKPSTSVVSKTFRSSDLLEQLPSNVWPSSAYKKATKEWKQVADGFTIEFGEEDPIAPPDKSLLFNGKFYLLTSPRTFSSAHMTAMEVKCYGLGTIIGEPTGERLNLTGEVIEFSLPNTRLKGIIPTARYASACGDGKQVGVQPDIHVQVQPADLIAGKDMVLEKLKSLCK